VTTPLDEVDPFWVEPHQIDASPDPGRMVLPRLRGLGFLGFSCL
jgi:hypothetical protein